MNVKNPTVKNQLPQEPYRFTKRIGSTTFHVAVYFNPNAKETAEDKIIRLIRNDAALVNCRAAGAELGKVANL